MSEETPRWSVEIERRAIKELSALPKPIVARCWAAIRSLEREAFPQGARSIQGLKNGYRIRVGNYRIVYTVDRSAIAILVIRIGHRKDVYRGL